MSAVSKSVTVWLHFKILSDDGCFWPSFASDKDQRNFRMTCIEGVHNKATSVTNPLKNMISGYRKERRGAVGRRKRVVAEQRKWKESSRSQLSCYCSLFWLSEDLTEPWPLCQQHEEVVRQTHNKTWCSWVLRNRGWGEREVHVPFWVCLCFLARHLRPPPRFLCLTNSLRLLYQAACVCRPEPHLLSLSQRASGLILRLMLSWDKNGPQSH